MYEHRAGKYTVVFELYFPSASIDHSSVDISATSSIKTTSWVSIIFISGSSSHGQTSLNNSIGQIE